MGRIHTLKTWPEYFGAVRDGSKRFELRENDRGFEVGDCLVLQEYDPATGCYTRECVSVRVTYIAQGVFGLPPDTCVMSIELWAPEGAPMNEYRNRKNGGIYQAIGIAKDATNIAPEGKQFMVYRNELDQLFVRELSEFYQKFDKVEPQCPKCAILSRRAPRPGEVDADAGPDS